MSGAVSAAGAGLGAGLGAELGAELGAGLGAGLGAKLGDRPEAGLGAELGDRFEETSGTSGIVRAMAEIDARVRALPSSVHAGLSASVALTVTERDTAASLRSGDVPVLGTPRLVALCEEASCRALDGRLGPDFTSVASRLQFDHLGPVAVGSTVTAEATLEKVEGRRLSFTISVALDADDRAGLIAAGRLTRVVVHRPTFLAKARCSEPVGNHPVDAGGHAGGHAGGDAGG